MKIDGKCYVGIDSGGTKCEVLIASEELKVISSRSFAGAHYSVTGADEFSGFISKIVKESFESAGIDLKKCIKICVGAAGAREETDREKISKGINKKLRVQVITTTDAMTALAGSFDSEDGIILISGTGSVLYGKSSGKIYRVGGWGRIIGDEGSGYWIGKKALNAVSREYDEKKLSGKPGRLSAALKKLHGIDKSNINSKVFGKDLQIQTLAPTVISCAVSGCRQSRAIIEEAIEGLLWHVETFLRLSRRRKPIDLAFIGSVVENKNILSAGLKKKIEETGIIRVVARKHSPAFGAAKIASGKFEIKDII